MRVTALLEPQIVGGADAGQGCQFLAAQTRNTPPRAGNQPDIFGTDLLVPQLLAALFKSISEQRCRQRSVDKARGDKVDAALA